MKTTEKPARLRRLFCAGLVLALPLSGCDRREAQELPDSIAAASGTLDTVVSIEESLQRFRSDLPAVEGLEGGTSSRDALVRAFVDAVEKNDTAAVARLHISRAEYAYLYYPSSIYVKEPYRQPPQIAWFLSSQSGEKGISRILRRLGGRELKFRSYECAEEINEGANTFWRSCALNYLDPLERTRVTRRLFGSIIEHGGQYKFLSYSNDL